MQAGIDADHLPRRLRNRARRLRGFGRRRAGQPEIISPGIDDEPLRREIRNESGEVRRGREPRQAIEIGADALFKGTQVDGVYSADPKKDPNATRFERISHDEVINRGLSIMDTAAIALARENNIPIIVYSIHEKGVFGEILKCGGRCTVVADT